MPVVVILPVVALLDWRLPHRAASSSKVLFYSYLAQRRLEIQIRCCGPPSRVRIARPDKPTSSPPVPIEGKPVHCFHRPSKVHVRLSLALDRMQPFGLARNHGASIVNASSAPSLLHRAVPGGDLVHSAVYPSRRGSCRQPCLDPLNGASLSLGFAPRRASISNRPASHPPASGHLFRCSAPL